MSYVFTDRNDKVGKKVRQLYFTELQDAVIDLDEKKVSAVEGKGLSTNDFTNEHKAMAESVEAKATASTFSFEVAVSDWVGSQAPYTATIAVVGILDTDNPIADINLSGIASYLDQEVAVEAWMNVYRITTGNDAVIVYASELPSVDLPIQLQVVR
jgi:hypothetical protein